MHKRDFGSFHVSNVQELLASSEAEYHSPKIPFEQPKIPSVDSSTFGKDAKAQYFFLEEDCVFLNHGAFGAVLRPALLAAQRWQEYIERQPLRFYDRLLMPHLVDVTHRMAKFVNCDAEDLVLVPNVTTAVNCVLRSVPLSAGDTVLHLSTEYGAVKKIIQEICAARGANVAEAQVTFPLADEKQIVSSVAERISPKTRLVVVDHIPSNTPYIAPIRQVVDVCHDRGVLVLVDGAHALGQLDLDIRSFGADFYTTNCHKWLCSPKGAALLYVAKEHKSVVRPLVISHGYGSGFNSEFIWSGLRDYSPFLALHTVLDFWTAVGPTAIREYTHGLARDAGQMLVESWRSKLLVAPHLTGSMLCVQLPAKLYERYADVTYSEAETVQNLLYHNCRIEVPIKCIQGDLYVRISAHIHNTIEEYHILRDAVCEITEGRLP